MYDSIDDLKPGSKVNLYFNDIAIHNNPDKYCTFASDSGEKINLRRNDGLDSSLIIKGTYQGLSLQGDLILNNVVVESSYSITGRKTPIHSWPWKECKLFDTFNVSDEYLNTVESDMFKMYGLKQAGRLKDASDLDKEIHSKLVHPESRYVSVKIPAVLVGFYICDGKVQANKPIAESVTTSDYVPKEEFLDNVIQFPLTKKETKREEPAHQVPRNETSSGRVSVTFKEGVEPSDYNYSFLKKEDGSNVLDYILFTSDFTVQGTVSEDSNRDYLILKKCRVNYCPNQSSNGLNAETLELITAINQISNCWKDFDKVTIPKSVIKNTQEMKIPPMGNVFG